MNLKDGDFVDLAPLVERLIESGHVAPEEEEYLRTATGFEYAVVEEIVFEEGPDGLCVVIYNNLSNLVVGADWDVFIP